MRSFQGTAVNMAAPILARVTKNQKRKWLQKSRIPQVLLITRLLTRLPKADAYLSAGPLPTIMGTKMPYIHELPAEICQLNEGDVVLLGSDGRVNVVYEISAAHNALMATNRCNLKCVMCPQPSGPDPKGMLDHNLAIIRLMDPERTPHLAITGGEPTLIGEEFFELIEACKKYLPKTSLIVLSNGKRFRDIELVRKLALVRHPNLIVAVPLYSDIDTIHDDIVAVPGSFYETLKGLYNLALFKQRVEIRTVIHGLNWSRLPNLAEFIYHNIPFAVHVALMGMETTGLARENIEQLWMDPHDYISELKRAVKYLHRTNMNVSIYNHQLCILPKELWPFCRQSISKWKNIYLSECDPCAEKNRCGGFFETGGTYYSKHIRCISL